MLRAAPVLAFVAAALAAAPAEAATRHGITPLAPLAGASVPDGRSPVFRLRARGPGQVWVRICKSDRRSKAGLICADESTGRARKAGGAFEYEPRYYGFPGFWANRRGTYYWQAHRIHCNASDCRQEGPVVRFQVA